jgi:TldD protein
MRLLRLGTLKYFRVLANRMLDSLRKALRARADFVEVRAANSWSNTISVRDSDVEEVKTGGSFGVSVRVLNRKSWGFASTNDLRKLPDAVKAAVKGARAASRKPIDARLAAAEPVVDTVVTHAKRQPADIPLEEKVGECVSLAKRGRMKSIVTTDLKYLDSWGEVYYLNSEGAEIVYKPVRSYFSFTAFAKKGPLVVQASERDARLVGVELLEGKEEAVEKASRQAVALLRAKRPPSGPSVVVVDPKMAGVLAHEAVGHASEADIILNEKSVLGDKKGRLVGSPLVSIVDDATLPQLNGSYPYDAEGVPAQRKVLIDRGRVRSFLHSRETAAKLGARPTGNARAESVEAFPLVRMSNTFFEAGDSSMDELLEGIKRGVFAHGMRGGITEPAVGFFQFACEYGYLIENGELTTPLRDVTLVGNILETLHHVDAVGKDWAVGTPGTCGKGGQGVPVSDGGPHLRIRRILVG